MTGRLGAAAGVFATALLLAAPAAGLGQEEAVTIDVPPSVVRLNLPNGGGKSINTPTGWGAAYGSVFGGGGYQNPTAFGGGADATLSAGLGLWDPVLYVGVQPSVTMHDVSEQGEFSAGLKVHRYLGAGTAVAAGADNLFAPPTDGDPSVYLAASHTVQGLGGAGPGTGRVHLSAGVGTGRFSTKPLRAQRAGKGEDGTYVFGSVAVETFRDLNVVAEWDGVRLNTALSYTMPQDVAPVTVTAGVSDWTEEAAERPRFVMSAGLGLRVF